MIDLPLLFGRVVLALFVCVMALVAVLLLAFAAILIVGGVMSGGLL